MTHSILRPRALAITLGLVLAASVVAFSLAPTTTIVPSVGAASSDYYLEIDGIKGESTKDKNHPNSIEIMSWSWGATNATTVGGGGAGGGKISPKPIVISKPIDGASPDIFKACASGKHIKTAKLFVTRPTSDGNSQDYLAYTFSDVFCTSFQNEGSGGDRPMESLSFTYAKIEMKYLPQTQTGSTNNWKTSGWDLKMNKGL